MLIPLSVINLAKAYAYYLSKIGLHITQLHSYAVDRRENFAQINVYAALSH